MLKVTIIGAALLWGSALQAQAPVGAPGGEAAPKPQSAGEAPAPSTGATGVKFTFEVGVAPEIDSNAPFTRETDSTDVSWTLGIQTMLGSAVDLAIKVGPTATVDSDRDSEASSKFNIQARLSAHAPIHGLTPTFQYQFSRLFRGFYEGGNGVQHTFDLLVGRQVKFDIGTFDISVGARRRDSSLAAKDFWSARLRSELTFPLFHDAAKLTFDANVERQRYDQTDPTIGQHRRDWTFEASAGFDFAHAVNAMLNSTLPDARFHRDIFSTFLVGGSWTRVNSNVDAQDSSRLKFAPSIAIRVSF
jgi:hypothetical protein